MSGSKIVWAIGVLLLGAIPSPGAAAPVVTDVGGTVSDGAVVVVGGSQFGSKPSSAPLKWETFDSGEAGALLSTSGYWSVDSDNPDATKPQYSDEKLRLGRGLNAMTIMQRPENYGRDIFYRSGLGFGAKVYVTFWVRYDYGTPDNGHQVKLWRLCQGAPGDTYPDLTFYDGGVLGDGTVSHWPRNNVSAGDGDSRGYSIQKPAVNQWSRIAVELYTGTVGGNDATFKVWHNGALASEQSGVKFLTNSDDEIDAVWFGEYLGNISPASAVEHFDDIYLDNTWARVEIGDQPVFANCTHREIQVPIDWSSNSISVQVNQGAHPSGSTAYLFVIDENGEPASEGFPIQFDGTAPELPGIPGKPEKVGA